MCTSKEMCEWLVAQLCDRMETGQIWVMAKTYGLLSTMLWRGSNSFVVAVRDYGKALFHASYIVTLMRRTTQENLSGTRLPCSLQPIGSASAAQKSACGKSKPQPVCLLERMKRKACGKRAGSAGGGQDGESCGADAQCIPEGDVGFLTTNIAYLESLCEYRVRHPTLDLAHGDILGAGTLDGAAKADPSADSALEKTYSVTVWKELLDDTLELMKATASTDPQAQLCSLSISAATTRVRESVLLYQVACRALVRLLHAVLTVSQTFVTSMQAGLQVPFSNSVAQKAAGASPQEDGEQRYFGKGTFSPLPPDYNLSPDVLHNSISVYYYAIYQFNRTVNMLRTYCETAAFLDVETSKKALAAFKVLPGESISSFQSSRKAFLNTICSKAITKLHDAARQSAETRVGEGGSAASESHLSESDVSSSASAHLPLSDEETRQSMKELYQYHVANHERKERLWSDQVEAVCDLFDEKEAKVLRQIFTAGVDGLRKQWREFTNNGAAAAERALASVNSNSLSEHASSNAHGLSASGSAASGDRSSGRQGGATDSLTRSSTYILRSSQLDVRARMTPTTKSDVISVNRSSLESSTESAIDALLQEDDVVVICNEECSTNDKLKLVDRFQVLMDVPLGEGSYGKVYRAWDEVMGCYLAAKELPLDVSKAHDVAVREVLQEYTVLTELSHPNIVRVVAFMVLKRTARIYMEWMPSGSLQDVLRHHPRGMLREGVVRRYARDVLSGLVFLHSRGVIHRDVKPGNMLLSSDGAVKLTDFGTSLVLSGNHRTLESNSVAGTAAYMAPECVHGTYSSASDIWSFGCSVVQLVSGNVPWCSPTTGSISEPIALLFKIGSLDDTKRLERPHDVLRDATKAELEDDDPAASLSPHSGPEVGAMRSEPENRSSKGFVSAELLDMLDSIFVVDRKRRPSASELLQHAFFKAA
ncbi:putative protein kinase [Leptomonas seymouri]|uniref:Protein kinase domain-containing protein n=1 Tax=Leptomonas seymouri TaxID=5684 RepID=A0A0N1P903_LEPSE|nr:putative protein kinase [Leptomonas seymouri]|eukprot:KPI82633.1 putative protein kinase [Leptomonas seymouri]